jgi:hypothetical protein
VPRTLTSGPFESYGTSQRGGLATVICLAVAKFVILTKCHLLSLLFPWLLLVSVGVLRSADVRRAHRRVSRNAQMQAPSVWCQMTSIRFSLSTSCRVARRAIVGSAPARTIAFSTAMACLEIFNPAASMLSLGLAARSLAPGTQRFLRSMQGQAHQRRKESSAANGTYRRPFVALLKRKGADPGGPC